MVYGVGCPGDFQPIRRLPDVKRLVPVLLAPSSHVTLGAGRPGEPLLVPLFNSRGEALEKPLLTIPDLITRDKAELTVTEFKTSGRRYGESETESSLQASCYAHAVQDRYDEQPRVRYTVLVKTKTPQIQHLETVPALSEKTAVGCLGFEN